MSTYKRRIVYLSDPEWATLTAVAKERKATISATIRDMIAFSVWGESPADEKPMRHPVRAAQAQRDDLLRKINRSK